jgi:hypothetical protein
MREYREAASGTRVGAWVIQIFRPFTPTTSTAVGRLALVLVSSPQPAGTFWARERQIMPIAGFRYGLSEISSGSYFEPYARYDVSFAGDPTKRNISNLQLAPLFTLALPETWFISLYPSADIRVNFGDPVTGQTGRLFLPFDARVGRKLNDHTVLSFEVGVPIIKDYPFYNFKAEVRLNVPF